METGGYGEIQAETVMPSNFTNFPLISACGPALSAHTASRLPCALEFSRFYRYNLAKITNKLNIIGPKTKLLSLDDKAQSIDGNAVTLTSLEGNVKTGPVRSGMRKLDIFVLF